MTRILVLEEISPAGLKVLREVAGFEVRELYAADEPQVHGALETAEALVIRSKTKVTEELLSRAPALKVIGRPGTGVDNVDVAAATRRGIVVMNTPAGNSISAAEHALALALALARRIPRADATVKEGRWDRKQFMGTELNQKTLGIVGFGKIGTEVARRAQAFGMSVLAFDPYVSDTLARDNDISLVPLEELLSRSDIVSLHAPLTSATRGMIGAAAFAQMKDGSYLVNAARGDLVDEDALIAALKSGKLAGAALDVFANEPQPKAELVTLPNVVATPHIGASTLEAQEKVGYDIAVQIRDYFRDGIARNAVNFPSISVSEYRKIAPFLQLGEKLGSFAGQIAEGRLQEITVRYYGDLTELNTHLLCSSIVAGVLKPTLSERVTLVNAVETARERGIHILESRSTRERSHSNLVSVKAFTDEGVQWVEGTVLHKDRLHIVSLHGIDVDAPLAGTMLVIRNTDTPGVIGRVGSLLGDSNINIANFALGRKESSQQAVGIVNLDSEVPDTVLEEIRSLPQVLEARLVQI